MLVSCGRVCNVIITLVQRLFASLLLFGGSYRSLMIILCHSLSAQFIDIRWDWWA